MNTEPQDILKTFQDAYADQAEFLRNFQEAGQIWLEISQMMQTDMKADVPLDPLNLNEVMGNAILNFWREPEKAIAKQVELISGFSEIWSSIFLGNNTLPKAAKQNHKRFGHEAWQENMILAFLKSCYHFMHAWVDDVVHHIDGLSEHDELTAGLTARNLVEALSPANFAMTNPEIIETTIREKGANLVRGLKMMREDVERGKGQLLIRQVDYSAFAVGENVAVTPGKVIYQNGHFQIIQYAPQTEKVHKTPILIVPPWINKYYILDLNEKKSFAKWLVAQGYTVFMVSWINADETTRDFTWHSRLVALREAIGVVTTEAESPQTHLISFCIGGTMVGSMLAEMSKSEDNRAASTTFLTAQFDFEHAGELMAFVSDKAVALLDTFEEKGFIPAESMSTNFNLLRSNDLIWSYVVNNYWLGKTPMAFDLLYWNSDSMRMPVKVQKFYLEQFYLKNDFMKNQLPLGDHFVGVQDITVPTYHLAAIEDHIAPAASVYLAAKAMTNADVRYVLSGSGHIAGVVNPPEMQKYGYWRNDDLSAENLNIWREKAVQNEGSWWLDWADWMSRFGEDFVPARNPGKHHRAIEDAPGSYVRVRFDD